VAMEFNRLLVGERFTNHFHGITTYARAATRAAPIANITVAAPVAMSPPANTPLREVLPVSGSVITLPCLPTSNPCVVLGMSGLDHIYRYAEVRPLYGDRASPTGGVGFTQSHPYAFHLFYPTVFICMVTYWDYVTYGR